MLAKGHVEEAERWALSAVETVGMQDTMSRSNVRMVLGMVRAAQGRDEEAELLLRDAIDSLAATDYRNSEPEPLAAYARFLRSRGRDEEASSGRGAPRRAPRAGGRGPDHLSTARIAWLDVSSGDSEITVVGRSKPASASRSGSARSVPSP